MEAQTQNTQEAEAEGLEVQGHSYLPSKFEVDLRHKTHGILPQKKLPLSIYKITVGHKLKHVRTHQFFMAVITLNHRID